MSGPGAPAETDAFMDLLKEAGLGTELAWWIVHHVNKAGQVSGDFDRHPDTLIRYAYEGRRRNKLTWEKIRWGDQGREPLVLEWLDESVGYKIIDTTQPDVDWAELERRILDAIAEDPGCSQRRVEELAGGKAAHIRNILHRLVEQRQIENRGSDNKKSFHLASAGQTTLDDPNPDELEWT